MQSLPPTLSATFHSPLRWPDAPMRGGILKRSTSLCTNRVDSTSEPMSPASTVNRLCKIKWQACSSASVSQGSTRRASWAERGTVAPAAVAAGWRRPPQFRRGGYHDAAPSTSRARRAVQAWQTSIRSSSDFQVRVAPNQHPAPPTNPPQQPCDPTRPHHQLLHAPGVPGACVRWTTAVRFYSRGEARRCP